MTVSQYDIITAIKNDKEDGYKSGTYYFNNDMNRLMVFDTSEELNMQEHTFKINDINLYKIIPISEEICNIMGIKTGNIRVYRHKNNENIDILCLSPIFGYLPADCETTLIQLYL